jgi:hypothetical protein
MLLASTGKQAPAIQRARIFARGITYSDNILQHLSCHNPNITKISRSVSVTSTKDSLPSHCQMQSYFAQSNNKTLATGDVLRLSCFRNAQNRANNLSSLQPTFNHTNPFVILPVSPSCSFHITFKIV